MFSDSSQKHLFISLQSTKNCRLWISIDFFACTLACFLGSARSHTPLSPRNFKVPTLSSLHVNDHSRGFLSFQKLHLRFLFVISICVVCVCVCVKHVLEVFVWRSENNFLEWFYPFHLIETGSLYFHCLTNPG